MQHSLTQFAKTGFEVIPDFLSKQQLEQAREILKPFSLDQGRGGVRNIHQSSAATLNLIKNLGFEAIARSYLGDTPHLVRSILFDKTARNNWTVAWHQDRTIAVSGMQELENWGPWTVKAGVIHVEPPRSVLESMITCRLHLDDTNTENGCLRMLAGSHNEGILTTEDIKELLKNNEPVELEVAAGALIVMRPLCLHASRKASNPSSRRILHLEFSSAELPSGIFWN
ncbi:hypothetical protein GCM10017044_04050 [Kordiimonas sediminis]|uniref:Phytanoyl-CoA dioxygenase n=1 Tax=Kordiimonas sediminis TaxID=1735581 RepID=A0A919AM13_9PROT|nr:phytanoyl-CoA dioxygenase family protein [Kordiimonas sediminis]GHF13261.1 hypothetical protein GCM10017044_04050 [Kordiimonas sediminis]